MPTGLNSADLRARATVPTLRRNGSPANADPLAEASRVTKEMVANRMMIHAVNAENAESVKAEAEAARAETEKLAAQIELHRLQETARGDGQGPDQWQTFILEELKQTRQGLEEARGQVAQMQVSALMERLTMLEGELGRIRERPQEAPRDTTALVTAAIQEARGLMEIVTPQGPATLPPADGAMVEAWKYRAQLDHERWQVQHQADHEARMEKIKQDGETARADIKARQDQAAITNRFFSETAPQLIPILKQVATGLLPHGAQAAASPQAAAPGVIVGTCQNCGQPIYYRETWTGVICASCGEEHTITPDQPTQQVATGGTDGAIA